MTDDPEAKRAREPGREDILGHEESTDVLGREDSTDMLGREQSTDILGSG